MAENSDDLVISISTDLATVRRSLKRLEADIASSSNKVEKQFDSMGKGIDKSMSTALQTRINQMVGVGVQGAKEWNGALADQGKELDRLRAKYSPLFATINSYKTTVSDIRKAHALGAISATEMTAAIQKERQAALASTAAIKGRNAALADTPAVRGNGASPYTSNIAAQFQDIGVTAMGGMSPLQIALQQGTQLSAVFTDLKSTGQSTGAALASAFASVVSPLSLITIGVVAASAAAIQYFGSLKSDVKTADDAIKSHTAAIEGIRDAYGVAAEGLGDYTKKTRAEADAAVRENLRTQEEVAKSAAAAFNKTLGVLAARTGGASDIAGKFRPFTDAIREFRKSLADGEPDFVKLQARINEIVATNPEGLRKLGDEIINNSNAASEAQRRMQAAKDVIDDIGDVAAGQADGVRNLKSALAELSQIATPALTDAERAAQAYQRAMQTARGREARDDVADAYRIARERIENQNPTIANSDGRTVSVPVPGQKPSSLDGSPNAEIKKAETAAQKAANAYRDLLKSADDRIAQLKLEGELFGQYGAATDAARFRLELLQQSEDKGRSLDPEQRKAIDEKVAAYAKYSEALANAKFQQDMLDQARMSSMSARDQKVLQTLRQYGLSEDMGGAAAGQIREQLRGQEISDATTSFLTDFKNALLENGGDIGDAFGKSLLNALTSSMNEQLDSIIKQIGGALGRALTGQGGAASPVSVAASAASTLAAPVATVTRAPLSGVSNYARAIQSIESGGNYGALGPITRNGDRAYGAYQMMGNNIGPWSQAALGRTLTPDQFLADRGAQDAIFNHRFGGYVNRYGASGAAQAWFGGPGSVGKGGMAADDLGTTGNSYVAKFNAALDNGSKSATQALEKLAGASGESTKGLSSLASSIAAAPGASAGGGGAWLSLLAGTPFAGSGQLAASGGIGLFDRGGFTGVGGKKTPAGIVHKGEYVFDAETVSRLGISTLDKLRGYAAGGYVDAPVAPRMRPRASAASGASQPSMLTVQIDGASGDANVRELVRQGVGQALSEQNQSMRRGGFGTMQAQYVSQKG